MKTAYGIPVPRGVPQDWTARDRSIRGARFTVRGYGVPLDWGDPVNAVAWYDRFDRCRLVVAHYANGRAATIRIDANGARKLSFGDVPRDSDAMLGTKPEGLSPEGVAARAAESGIAQKDLEP